MFDPDDVQVQLRVLDQLKDKDCAVTLGCPLGALDLFMAISAIQLALRHPGFPVRMRPNVERTTLAMIEAVANLATGVDGAGRPLGDQDMLRVILMAGFDAAFDR